MAISYPVPSNSRWAFYDTNESKVLSRNQLWPEVNGDPIPGAEPHIVPLLDVQYLPVDHPGHVAKPVFDSRLFSLEIQNTIDIPNNRLEVAYSTPALSTEERKVNAENRESEETAKFVRIERELVETRLMLAAVLQYIDGSQWPPKVQTMADTYRAKGVKLWKNRDRLKAILAQIDNGEDPDLDAGWEPEE